MKKQSKYEGAIYNGVRTAGWVFGVAASLVGCAPGTANLGATHQGGLNQNGSPKHPVTLMAAVNLTKVARDSNTDEGFALAKPVYALKDYRAFHLTEEEIQAMKSRCEQLIQSNIGGCDFTEATEASEKKVPVNPMPVADPTSSASTTATTETGAVASTSTATTTTSTSSLPTSSSTGAGGIATSPSSGGAGGINTGSTTIATSTLPTSAVVGSSGISTAPASTAGTASSSSSTGGTTSSSSSSQYGTFQQYLDVLCGYMKQTFVLSASCSKVSTTAAEAAYEKQMGTGTSCATTLMAQITEKSPQLTSSSPYPQSIIDAVTCMTEQLKGASCSALSEIDTITAAAYSACKIDAATLAM